MSNFVVSSGGNAELLIVAGGAGGGYFVCGGGGAGGVLHDASHSFSNGTYPVVVGLGGTGGNSGAASNGGDSSIDSLSAIGGGAAGSFNGSGGYPPAQVGGSGGGGGSEPNNGAAGTMGQGNAGGNGHTAGYAGGGGGGASAVGADATTSAAGNGGDGLQFSISGTPTYYGGGGGGGGYPPSPTTPGTGGLGGGGNGSDSGPGSDGVDETGGGGGSGGANAVGGRGGNGVVIISYPTGSLTATGGTVTTSGGNTIHTFSWAAPVPPVPDIRYIEQTAGVTRDYATIQKQDSLEFWNTSGTPNYEVQVVANMPQYAISMSELVANGCQQVATFPAIGGNMIAGFNIATIRRRSGAPGSELFTDPILQVQDGYWDGTTFDLFPVSASGPVDANLTGIAGTPFAAETNAGGMAASFQASTDLEPGKDLFPVICLAQYTTSNPAVSGVFSCLFSTGGPNAYLQVDAGNYGNLPTDDSIQADAAAAIADANLALESSLSNSTITLNAAYDAAKTAATQASVDEIEGETDAILTGQASAQTTLNTISATQGSQGTLTNQNTLLSRFSAARAGYLDNLNVGGAVASHVDIAAINQSASRSMLMSTVGQYAPSEVYTVEMRTYNKLDGTAVNADTTPTLTATGAVTGSLSGNLSAATNPATGVYRWTYTPGATPTLEQIRMDGSAAISSATYTLTAYTQTVDQPTATFTATDKSNLTSIFNKLPSGNIADQTTLTAVQTALTNSTITIAANQHVIVDGGTVTTLTNLPSIPANWLTASGIAANALNGKGDWLLASSVTVSGGAITSNLTKILGTTVAAVLDPNNNATLIALDASGSPAGSSAIAPLKTEFDKTGTTVGSDWVFSANTLQHAGGSGLTSQQTRDSMKLAPSGGAAAAGSIDAQIAGVPAATDTELSGNHGSGAWGPVGPNTSQVTVECKDSNDNPIVGAQVYSTTDQAGTANKSGIFVSDSNGNAVCEFTRGSVYVWMVNGSVVTSYGQYIVT